ncbi:MAG TPA: hypothetical protein VGX76_05980 [Pirellulales bacterium]|nr:hypothetical protein [Pirellulales bacterium]
MEFNRNQYFILGLVVLLLGLQIRMVETFVLNEKASRFLAERMAPSVADADGTVRPFLPAVGPTPRRTLRPPTWMGFALISTGAVLVLHSLAMKKPGA